MAHTLHDARRWMQQGTQLFLDAARSLDAVALGKSSLLPAWSCTYVVAHVAANADALENLVHWAATGEKTPMYRSPEERAASIERGSHLAPDALGAWLEASAWKLEAEMAALTEDQWQMKVVTAQGRTVTATEIPWMRDREVFVHAVDLNCGVKFADLPSDFLDALREDIVAKRGLSDDDIVDGPLSEVVAWLAGRRHHLHEAPKLGPWL